MTPAQILAMLAAIDTLAEGIVGFAKGQQGYTDEERAEIKARAETTYQRLKAKVEAIETGGDT